MRKLFEWVKDNIAYQAIYLEDGGFVPDDANKILMNKSGDCKGHVVLLEALLKAKNISSTAVLINTTTNSMFPEIVRLETFNHVITYIPELAMYLDSTNMHSSFGKLPTEDRGRPALHINGITAIQSIPQ